MLRLSVSPLCSAISVSPLCAAISVSPLCAAISVSHLCAAISVSPLCAAISVSQLCAAISVSVLCVVTTFKGNVFPSIYLEMFFPYVVKLFIFREGLVSKRSGGHSQVTNCLGCHACCVCRFSVWRIR